MAEPVDALTYHERTNHTPESVRASSRGLDFENKPTPFKIYEDLPSVALPDPEPIHESTIAVLGRNQPAPEGAVDIHTVATLCHRALGITKRIGRGQREIAFRAAACTGALYHVDGYLITGELESLPAGVYHYDPRTHSLDRLREQDHRSVVASAAALDRPATLYLILTSTWWRNAWKYRARTFRHAFWDSGTVLANAHAAARAADTHVQIQSGFVDMTLARLLGIETAQEAPLEILAIGPPDDGPEVVEVPEIDPRTQPLSPNERSYPLIHRAYRAGTLDSPDQVRRWRRSAETVPDPPGTRSEELTIDPVDDHRAVKTPLDVTIRRRGSCREFQRSELSARKVATIFDRAVTGGPLDVRSQTGPPMQFVEPFVVVHDVDGWPPGAYRLQPEVNLLQRYAPSSARSATGHAALDQQLAADASVVVFFMADLPTIVDLWGNRGYRVAQLEAAFAGGRLYLAAAAHRELGSTGLTFYDTVVPEVVGLENTDWYPMFCWALGKRPT